MVLVKGCMTLGDIDMHVGRLQEHIDLAKADFPLVFKDILDLDHFERNMFFLGPHQQVHFFQRCAPPHVHPMPSPLSAAHLIMFGQQARCRGEHP